MATSTKNQSTADGNIDTSELTMLIEYIKAMLSFHLAKECQESDTSTDERHWQYQLEQRYRWFTVVMASTILYGYSGNGHFDKCIKHLYVHDLGDNDTNSIQSLKACDEHWAIVCNATKEADDANGNNHAITEVLQDIETAAAIFQHGINFTQGHYDQLFCTSKRHRCY